MNNSISTVRLPLIPPKKTIENNKSKQKERRNIKKETRKLIREF